jgi:tetratricopeptide (TPR) repeat protein
MNDPVQEIEVRIELAKASENEGDVQNAVKNYKKALAAAKKLNDLRRNIYILGRLGLAYFNLSDFDQAIEIYDQIKALVKERRDKESSKNAIYIANIGTIALPQKSLPVSIPSITGFVGREEDLAELAESYRLGTRFFVLHGMGGVGKTALALQFANQIAPDFKAKIFVDMRGRSKNPLSARDTMLEIVRQFGSDVRQFEKDILADILEVQLKSLFIQLVQNQPTLIVLDNAPNKESVEPLIRTNACFITTSREAFSLTASDSNKNITQMTSADARRLLFRIAGEERLDGKADELAELGGYLPVALQLLASLLAEDPSETALNLLSRYRDRKEILEKQIPDYEGLTVNASFELSYESLTDDIKKSWRCLSVFPSDFDERAMAAVLNLSRGKTKATHRRLRKLNLLETTTETMRFNMHDLIRTFAIAKLSNKERSETQFLFAKYYALVLREVEDDWSERPDHYLKLLKRIDTDFVNILTAQKWTAEFQKKSKRIAALCLDYTRYAHQFIELRLHPREDIDWLTSGLKAARKLEKSKLEGECLEKLGNAYYNTGEYGKSIDYQNGALKISRKPPRDLKTEGNSLSGLGRIYRTLGEYSKAIHYHEQALEIFHKINDRPSEGASLDNLGNAYQALGEYRKAITFHEQSLEISQEMGDRREEGRSLKNLGAVYRSLGQYRKAIGYYKKSLKISRRIGDRIGEGKNLSGLGNAYDALAQYEKAIEFHERSLEISRRIGNREGESASLNNLGNAYESLDDHQKAISYHEQSLEISRETGNREGEGISLNNLGNAYINLGMYQKATEFYQQFLDISQETGYREGQGSSLSNLGMAYYRLGEKAKAYELWNSALSIFKAIESPNAETVQSLIDENGPQ